MGNLALDIMSDAIRSSPQLRRGKVWCLKCGKVLRVKSMDCMSYGWPKCCEQTMSLDSPEERKAIKETNYNDTVEVE